MGHDHSHADMLDGLVADLAVVLEHCSQGVYLWLDEETKVCNEQLAQMFGYTIDEWQSQVPFLESFVAPEDQSRFAANYQRAIAGVEGPATFRFRAVRKDGSMFDAETDMIPLSAAGHVVAYHFVRPVD